MNLAAAGSSLLALSLFPSPSLRPRPAPPAHEQCSAQSHNFSASASTGTLNPHLPVPQEQLGFEGAVLCAQGQQEGTQAFLEGHTGTGLSSRLEPGTGQGGEAEPAALISATFGVSSFSSCELAGAAGWRARDNREVNETSAGGTFSTQGRTRQLLLALDCRVIYQKGRVWFVLGEG